jgi:hypothetical protein
MKIRIVCSTLSRTVLRILFVTSLLALPGVSRGQDAFEPDDSPSAAKPIVNGQTQTHDLSPNDVDWATFTIGGPGALNLRIETGSPSGFNGDTQLWLYDGKNLTKELAFNDNASGGGFSLITLSDIAPGTYYIKVASAPTFDATFPYVLRATWTDRPDSFEPDNTAATARPLANGQSQERSIHTSNDEDWATFTIGTTGATNFRVETSGPIGDTELTLFGPNSSTTQIAYNDDKPGEKFSAIALNSLAPGTYFVRVSSFGLASTISAYTLRASWTESGDALESDDTPATAKPIQSGQPQSHSIHVATDVDWAVFTIGSRGASNVRIDTSGVGGDTEMWLYGPGDPNLQVAYNDDGPSGKFSQIIVNNLLPGTYYIKVTSYRQASIIPNYTLQASWEDAPTPIARDSFESDDTPATAKAIGNNQTQTRSIHVENDLDWVTFTIGGAGASSVQIATAGGSGDTEMWLYGPNNPNAELDYNDDGGAGKFAAIRRSSLPAGTYYIKIGSYRQSSTINSYTLAVSWTAGLPPPSRLANLSIRTNTLGGTQSLIVGFVVAGTGTNQVLLRGVGPTLSTFGVTELLADPTLQLFNGSTSVATNDNWGGNAAIRTAAAVVGAFALPDASRDGALLQTLNPGNYSAQIGGGSGVVLLEAYEVAPTGTARFSNISARAQVGTAGDVLIAGFVITGLDPKAVLVRAIGPGLTQFGVAGALIDPKLDVFAGSQLINSNDNWGGGTELQTAFSQVGAFSLPANSRDSALKLVLVPGAYSVQISGVNAATGIALVELYELP